MPAMADISVLNTIGQPSVYKAKTASAGDKIPAVWALDTWSTVVGFRPKFQVQTRDNGSSNARILEGNFNWPVTSTVNGVTTKVAVVPIDFRAVLPTNVDFSHSQEAFYQLGNLLVSDLIRQVADTGYAPT